MKTLAAVLVISFSFFANLSSAQLTGTKNIPGDYATLALAITDLNTQGVGAGGVTFNVTAAQTAPSGGYIIGNTGSAILSGGNATGAAKQVVIQGNGITVTAFSPQTAGNTNDGIFKLVGADYITIINFILRENPSNTNYTSGTNNVTEWGIALLRVSTTDGAQHNTIQNNTINQNINDLNAFGIYSNVMHTPAAPATSVDITNISGSNAGNKVYGNTITDANVGIVFVGSSTAAYNDDSNDVGGTAAATGNTITNFGTDIAQSSYANTFADNQAILFRNQTNGNVSCNTMTSATSTSSSVNTAGVHIYNNTNTATASVNTISYNTITVTKNASASYIYNIRLEGQTNITTFNITNNKILNSAQNASANLGVIYGIYSVESCTNLNITDNLVRGLSTNAGTGSFYGVYNSGSTTGTVNINNNQLGDAIAGLISGMNGGDIEPVYNANGTAAAAVNINNNSVDGISCIKGGVIAMIINSASTGVAVNIKNNRLGSITGSLISFSGVQTGSFYGIENVNTTGTSTITIQDNEFKGISHAVDCSYPGIFINNTGAASATVISGNTFADIDARTTGNINIIYQQYTMPSGASFTCNNNKVTSNFTKLGNGDLYGIITSGSSVSGSTITETGNEFTNITLSGTSSFYGIAEQEGVSSSNGPVKTITNNVFNTILGINSVYPIYVKGGVSLNCSGNTFSSITSGTITAILAGPSFGSGANYSIYNNTFTNLTGTAASAEAIECGSGITTAAIYGNSITGLRTSGTNVYGILTSSPTTDIYDNTITSVTVSAATGFIVGIGISAGTTVNVYRNKLYNMQHNATSTSTSATVSGIRIGAGTTVNIYNNFICDLKAPAVSGINVILGIEINSFTSPAAYNVYYNSVYLNASSTGTNFGTAGLYAVASASATSAALNLVNNVIVNTSTPNGTGATIAFRRSNTSLNNYTATSDYNLLYAGTPAANKLIYYDIFSTGDMTLAAFQARMAPRDANDISLMPNFVSPTDLHLTTNNCGIDNRGIPITGFTTDIDMATRSATIPDIGADEFTATTANTLAGISGSVICDERSAITGGTIYYNTTCDLIAKVEPSGASPVAGSIKVCVTKDVSVQTFNAEPYVARHFDMEPVNNAATSTAKVTLYFTNQEFVDFNAASAGFPLLPTLAGGGNSDPNIANLKVTQYHGTATTSPSQPGMYTFNGGEGYLLNPADADIVWNGSYWAVTFDVTGFSGFYIHTNVYYPLPITLNYLRGVKQGNKNNLSWKVTCNNTPKATLDLERSSNGTAFTTIYTITADAARCQQPFDFQDVSPVAGKNYYRLKMTDENGKFTYSNIIVLLNEAKGFEVINIAPNPVTTGRFKLNVISAENTELDIVITDMQGRVVQQQTVNMIAGYNAIDMNVTHLAAGTYSIYGTTVSNRSKVLRFVKQ